MKELSRKEAKQLVEKYGQPVHFNDKEKCIGVNQQFLAAEFAIIHEPIYYLPEECFYQYERKSGTWNTVTEEKLLDSIGILIHAYAKEFNDNKIATYSNVSVLTGILKLLKGKVQNEEAFAKRKGIFVHCANTMLEYNEEADKWEEKEFSPKYYSRNQSPISYNPKSKCPKFLNLLLKDAMTADDIAHLQMYLGQCLLRINLCQMFLLLIGTPGGGKSTLVNIIEGLVGRWNCTELRLPHMAGRFEISRTNGKSLLTAKDADSKFMNCSGAGILKALTGNDTMTAELKSSNRSFDVVGSFNVIITSNVQLCIKLDSDIEAWRRRLLLIKYEKSPTTNVIVDLDKKLLNEEGSGILNWALEGAAKLLKAGGKINKSPEQEAKGNMLLQNSRPFDVFAKLFIHPTTDASVTTEEVTTMFSHFCHRMDWSQLTVRKIQLLFHEWMRTQHGATVETGIKRKGSKQRGYSHFQIRAK